MTPDCDRFVPGYGDANADFHVIGDHPGIHGGVADGVPFTGEPWSETFLATLADAGLVSSPETSPETPPSGTSSNSDGTGAEASPEAIGRSADRLPYRPRNAFFSYLHMCDSSGTPTRESYADMERFFDAELRAIAAHVLLPVGERTTEHVFRQYTARARTTRIDMDALHATELLGSGWLVVPIKDPGEWGAGDGERLVSALEELRSTDFRRESDLGRFMAGDDPYLVR